MRFLGLPELIILAVVLIPLLLLPTILYLFTLQRALERCSPQARTMPPGNVWFLLIPLFGVGYHFVVVSNLSRSLANEYALRHLPLDDSQPGQSIGIAMCISTLLCIIPVAGVLAAFASLVCWIVYWVKIFGYSGALITGVPYDGAPNPSS
jgi:hypothetical protein